MKIEGYMLMKDGEPHLNRHGKYEVYPRPLDEFTKFAAMGTSLDYKMVEVTVLDNQE